MIININNLIFVYVILNYNHKNINFFISVLNLYTTHYKVALCISKLNYIYHLILNNHYVNF